MIPPPAIPRPRAAVFLSVAVFLVAANLRMTVTGVGPLLEQIGREESIGPAALGLLGSLTLLTWGLISPLSHWLSVRLGMSAAVTASLVVLAVGTLWRSLPGSGANLWIGTALIGAGLAVSNGLLPAVIKQEFAARLPLFMGVYTALLGGTAAAGAGLAVPLSQLAPAAGTDGDGSWRLALALLGAPIPLAILVWVLATRGARRERRSGGAAGFRGTAGRRIWGDRLAWQVSLYMGTQSAVYYSVSSWLASYQVARGVAPLAAGLDVMSFQMVGIAGSLALPLVSRGPRLQRILPALLPAATLIAWLGLVLLPAATPLWLALGGLSAGASLTVALTLMATRARTAEHATALSGMAQSLGYLIAAIGPVAFGALLGLSGGWLLPFALVWTAAAVQLGLGISLGRPRFVLDPSPPADR